MSSAPTETLKRTSTDAGLPEKPIRANKRRAPKACRCCRARKVRCNVMEYGAPCTNCRLDEVECVIAEGKRKSRKSFVLPQPQQEATSPSDNGNEDISGSLPDLRPLSAYTNDNLQFGAHQPHSIYQKHDTSAASSAPKPEQRLSPSASASGSGSASDSVNSSRLANLPGANPAYSSSIFRISKCLSQLPKYLKPLPSHLGFDENSYLAAKGALSLPESAVIEQILRAFAQWHFPLMPVVDIDFILRAVLQDNQNAKISLLMLQAVIYAGSAHVDLAWLRKAGYADRKAARTAFYHRTRLLYDFDCEPDRFTQVQALVLLTSWYATDEKEGWHWLGVAITTATSLGLNRDPSNTHLSMTQQRLCKRVWWSLVVRDRLMALGLRRPTCIKLQDCDVPMLTLEDYEPAQPQSLFDSQDDLRAIATIHMELARLSLCVGQVLTTQYSVNPSTGLLTGSTGSAALTPRTADPSATTLVNSCHHELEEWHANLSPDAHRPIEAELDPNFHSTTPVPILMNRALLHLIYFATLSALHRPQMIPGLGPPPDFSRHQVYSAAVAITSLARLLLAKNLMGHVPTFGTTVLLPAITKHLVDLRSPPHSATDAESDIKSHDEARKQSLQGFAYCIRAMWKLQENYAGADVSMALVEAAVQRASIRLTNPIVDSEGNTVHFATCVEDLMGMAFSENLLPAQQTLTPPPDEVDYMVMPAHLHSLPAGTNPGSENFAGIPNGNGTTRTMAMDLHHHLHGDHNHNHSIMSTAELLAAASSGSHAHIDTFLASTPPLSDHDPLSATADMTMELDTMGLGLLHNVADANVEYELQAFLDFDAGNDFAIDFDMEHAAAAPGIEDAKTVEAKQVEDLGQGQHAEEDEGRYVLGEDAIAMPHD